MKYVTLLMVFAFFVSCKSNQYTIEDNPNIVVKEAFYKEIPAAIKEGNSFAKITVVFDKSKKAKDITYVGVYFMDKYGALNEKNSTTYLSSIILPKPDEIKDKDFPFQLKPNEIVIHYSEGKKQKYALFKIKKKTSLEEVPR